MKQTNAYRIFSVKIQEIFNFAVLVTISVPVLKSNLDLIKRGVIKRLPDADYFEPSVIYEITEETLKDLRDKNLDEDALRKLQQLLNTPLNNTEFKSKVIDRIGEANYKQHRNTIKRQSLRYIDNIQNCTSDYQSKLAAYLYFSTFSYFEAFIGELFNEVTSSLPRLDNNSYFQSYTINEINQANFKKIDNPFDGKKIDRYKKLSKKMQAQGYQIPENILFSSLTELLISKIDNFRAVEIPDILENIFRFAMTKEEKEMFHNIRDNRNSIGHGNSSYTPSLTHVTNASKFFKELSSKIDKHFRFYFFKPENYSGSNI